MEFIFFPSPFVVTLEVLSANKPSVPLQWIISALIFGIGFSLYTAINLYGVLAMENGPPGLSGTSHAIVALSANGETCFCSYTLWLFWKTCTH